MQNNFVLFCIDFVLSRCSRRYIPQPCDAVPPRAAVLAGGVLSGAKNKGD